MSIRDLEPRSTPNPREVSPRPGLPPRVESAHDEPEAEPDAEWDPHQELAPEAPYQQLAP